MAQARPAIRPLLSPPPVKASELPLGEPEAAADGVAEEVFDGAAEVETTDAGLGFDDAGAVWLGAADGDEALAPHEMSIDAGWTVRVWLTAVPAFT